MSKILAITLLAIVAVAIAAEEIYVADDVVNLVEEDAKQMETVHMTAKATSPREQAKSDLEDAFAYANIDGASWMQEQELIESKQGSGKGYQELKPIMEKVDELEKKIRGRLATLKTNIETTRTVCARNRQVFAKRMEFSRRRIASNNASINNSLGSIKESRAVRSRSRDEVTKMNKALDTIRATRRADTDQYKVRLKKRMKEIEVLHKANMLVCTEFEDFKKTDICKDVLSKGKTVEDNKAQIVTKPLRDLLKEADEAEREAKEKDAAEKAKAGTLNEKSSESAVDKDKKKLEETFTEEAVETPEDDASAKQLNVARQINDLQELLADSDMGQRTFVPVRKAISLIRDGNKAAATIKDSKTQKEMNLPELMVHLLQRIANEQKRETLDFMSQLKSYHKQVQDQTGAIEAQVNKQEDEAKKIVKHQTHISAKKTDNVRHARAYTASLNAMIANNNRCRAAEVLYNVKKAGRERELVNLEKLRSLLRVLQNSDLPKCPGDCVDKDHGRCVWAGRFGKDSYCSCENEYYGEGCEHTKCKGKSQQLYEASDKDVCNTRGSCDKKDGTCTCGSRKVSINGTATHTLEYYHGQHKSCENARCPGNGDFDPTRDPSQKYACNRRGSCDIVGGTCRCDTKYYGTDCSRVKCPGPASGVLYEHTHPSACSGRGSCDYNNGTCRCDPKYTGSNCGQYTCPNNCSGRGTCNTNNGTCNCNNGYTGRDCSLRTCINNCHGSSYGSCNQVTGQCSCNSNGSGPNCRRPTLSQFYKAYYVWWTFDVTGWSWCHGNTFLVGIRRNSCPYLYCIEEFMCARPNEVSDTSYSHANGTRFYMPSMSSCSTYHFRWHTGSYWYEWAGGWGWNKRFWRSMIHRSCPGNMWINGLWRNGHIHPWYQNYLNNLWYFHCCSLGGGFYWTNCRWKSWYNEMATSRGSGSPYYPSLRWAVTSNFPTVPAGHDYGYPTSYYSDTRGYAGDYMIAGFGRSRMVEAGHINDLRVILECRYRR
jgi:hypothetical protein